MSATHPVGTIAKLLMLTERRVQQLSNEGIIPKAERGRYELVPAVQGYIRYLGDRNLGEMPGSTDDHKKRLLKARADLAEMEAAQLSGSLVKAELAEEVWSQAMSRVRQRMLSVAPKAAPVVAVETSAEVCHEAIEAFVHEALAELAGVTIQGSEGAGEGDSEPIQDIGTAAEADDFAMGGPESALIE
jgi:hypothetical protein